VNTTGLPSTLATAARQSVGGGLSVAGRLHDATLHASATAGYVHGMDLVLLVCGIAALPAALVVGLLLPGRQQIAVDETPVAVHAVAG
jgi:hypothetical protein